MNPNKTCTKCKEIKPMEAFSTNSAAIDGKHSWCRACVNMQRKQNKEKYALTQAAYRKNNPEKIKQWKMAERSKPGYKERKSARDKAYRIKMGKVLLQKKRDYVTKNREKVKVGKKQEYEKHKQAYIARAYQRLHNIKCLTPPDADKKQIQSFYVEAKRLSVETGIKHEVDHILPISKGGLHHQDNLQVLPWIENRKKGSTVAEIWANRTK